ncbi:MAG TPA: hypothetical protein PLX89_10490 [Verrucomicrobiota bacterium]|nr:hypothetical protein [Verrucomicrobiales bacterium]HRI13425.1 hypothetical protein [Verrucomicrobiota bacterium]
MKPSPANFEMLDKEELLRLCDRLRSGDSEAVDECVAFLEVDTRGVWHGRARAMMTRRLKHCQLSESQRARVVRSILGRLVSGCFSEQFKDQLRLVLQVAPDQAFAAARSCQTAQAEHVRRYAAWVLSHESPT